MTIDIPGLENFTAGQKSLIRNAIEKAKQEAINDAQQELRMRACRKPDSYNPSAMNIQDYFNVFEPFRRTMQLQGNLAVNAFLTYMDVDTKIILAEKGLATNEDWDVFRQETINILKVPLVELRARLKLKKASQTMDETVTEFGRRIEKLGKVGYPVGEEAAKDIAQKDALTTGVRSDDLGILLLRSSNKSFKDLLTQAITHEASCNLRKAMKSSSDDKAKNVDRRGIAKQASYLKNLPSRTRNSFTKNTFRKPNVKCYYCNRMGHYASSCQVRINRDWRFNGRVRLPKTCYFCGFRGHIARACRRKAFMNDNDYEQNEHLTRAGRKHLAKGNRLSVVTQEPCVITRDPRTYQEEDKLKNCEGISSSNLHSNHKSISSNSNLMVKSKPDTKASSLPNPACNKPDKNSAEEEDQRLDEANRWPTNCDCMCKPGKPNALANFCNTVWETVKVIALWIYMVMNMVMDMRKDDTAHLARCLHSKLKGKEDPTKRHAPATPKPQPLKTEKRHTYHGSLSLDPSDHIRELVKEGSNRVQEKESRVDPPDKLDYHYPQWYEQRGGISTFQTNY